MTGEPLSTGKVLGLLLVIRTLLRSPRVVQSLQLFCVGSPVVFVSIQTLFVNTVRTVNRDWAFARAWLYDHLRADATSAAGDVP